MPFDSASSASVTWLGIQAVERRLGVVDAHLQLRDAHLLFGLQIDDTGDRP